MYIFGFYGFRFRPFGMFVENLVSFIFQASQNEQLRKQAAYKGVRSVFLTQSAWYLQWSKSKTKTKIKILKFCERKNLKNVFANLKAETQKSKTKNFKK